MKKYIISGIIIFAVIAILRKFTGKKNPHSPNQIMSTFASPKDYVTKILPSAKALEKSTGIPALFILAQTALETGWGKSSLVPEAWNFGGIKARTGQPYVTKWTYEYVKDVSKYPNRDKSKDQLQSNGLTKIYVPQNFAKYPDIVTGLTEYSKILLLPRYKSAFNFKNDPYKFAEEIFKAGYATDINYVPKLKTMIDNVKKYL